MPNQQVNSIFGGGIQGNRAIPGAAVRRPMKNPTRFSPTAERGQNFIFPDIATVFRFDGGTLRVWTEGEHNEHPTEV